MIPTSSFKYYAALFLAVTVWSASIVITKLTIEGIGPLALSFFRACVAFLFLLPFALKSGFRFNMIFTKKAMMYGFFGYGGNLVLLTLGLQSCSANISAIIHGLFPVFMVFFGHLMLSERFTNYKFGGIFLSIVGVTIATAGDFSSNNSSLWGVILVILSMMTWAFYSVYAKKTAHDMPSIVLTQLCLGSSVLLIFPLFIGEAVITGFSLPDGPTILSILYLGIMSGGIAVILWNYGLRKVSSAISGIYFNLMPVLGLFFAFFIGERINTIQIAGCILVFAGVLLGTGDELKKRPL